MAEDIDQLFLRYQLKIHSSKSADTAMMTVGEFRYVLKSMTLLDSKVVKNIDIDILLVQVNAKKVGS